MKPEISNEQLNAFVDNELDTPEKDSLFNTIESYPELAQQVCELRAIKELVRHAYAESPASVISSARKFYVPQSFVAGVMLALGLTLGWVGHDWNQPVLSQPVPAVQLVQGQSAWLRPVRLAGVTEDMHKVVMHVDSAEPSKMNTLLDDIDYLTQHQASLGQPVQVEVLASNYGWNMLRSDGPPSAARINALASKYPNLFFVGDNQPNKGLGKIGCTGELWPHKRGTSTAAV